MRFYAPHAVYELSTASRPTVRTDVTGCWGEHGLTPFRKFVGVVGMGPVFVVDPFCCARYIAVKSRAILRGPRAESWTR